MAVAALYISLLVCVVAQFSQDVSAAVCSVEVAGRPGANLHTRVVCGKGGKITAALLHPDLQKLHVTGDVRVVQQWGQQPQGGQLDSCGLDVGHGSGQCLLVLCDAGSPTATSVVHLFIKVQNVLVSNDTTGSFTNLWGVVCIAGTTKAVVQDPVVTGNNIAGLVVTGSADVTITGGSFTDNLRQRGPGTALIGAGRASLRVFSSSFSNNSANGTGNYAGAMLIKGHAGVTVDNCTFHYNQAYYGWGGAFDAADRAVLTVSRSRFTKQQTTKGGVLHAHGYAVVTLSNCTMQDNWASWGGAIYAGGHSNVTLVGSMLLTNTVTPAEDYDNKADGGACYVNGSATLSVIGTVVHNNSAIRFGGGVAMGSTRANLHLGEGTKITGNSARQGGGIFILKPLEDMPHAADIVTRNKAVVSDDIGTHLVSLTPLRGATVPAFVPRLSDNKALLPVWLQLSGADGMSAAAAVQAVLAGRAIARNSSDPVSGKVLLNINLRRPPGTYRLVFEVMAMHDLINTNITVTVVDCGPGEINVTGENACMQCPRGSYSFDPRANECSRCPAHAVCKGGTVLPARGFWSSSHRSNQVHRCPYPAACLQEHDAANLLLYHNPQLWPQSDATFLSAQCVAGHEGNLCGRCSQNYGQRLSASVSRCSPCASTAQIICLYVTAALVSMLVIKCLCFLTARQSRQQPQPQPQPRPQAQAQSNSSAAPLPQSEGQGDSASSLAWPQASEHTTGISSASAQALTHTGPRSAVADCSAISPAAAGGSTVRRAAAHPSCQPHVPPGDLLKPLIVYLQWLLVVASINVDWPRMLVAPFAGLVWLFGLGSTATGLDCVLAGRYGSVALAVRNVLCGLLLPVVLLVVLLVADAAFERFRAHLKGGRGSQWQHSFSSGWVQQDPPSQPKRAHAGVFAQTCIVVVFFFLPSLLRTAYGMFACVQLDKAVAAESGHTGSLQLNAMGSFWLLDTDQLCYRGYHLGWALGVGVPLVLLLCIFLPLGVGCFLYRRRSHLKEEYFSQHFGFLYKCFKADKCFWEGVVAAQTCVVLAIGVFGATLGAPYQSLLLATTFVAVLVSLATFQPFNHTAANHTAAQSCACLMLTAQAALVFDMLAAEDLPKASVINGIAAAVLSVNVVFVVSVLWRVLQVVDWSRLLRAASTASRCAAARCSCSSCGCADGTARRQN